MGKRRAKDKSSREEDDIELSGPSCRHIKKGTEQTLLKKLSGNSNWTSCQDCSNDENKENVNRDAQEQDSQEEQEPQVAWLCLKCGHRGCGRYSENQHAIRHYETPRSDPHCLVINLDTWIVWCYICDEEVQYSKTGHLAQLISKLQKEASAHPVKTAQKKVKEEESSLEAAPKTEPIEPKGVGDNKETEAKAPLKRNTKKESCEKAQRTESPEESGGVSVKGLSNLGNTCFFNAVIQNLSQTHLLRQTLNKEAENRSLNIQPVASSHLEPLGVQLNQPGSLTVAMCQLLNEIQETKKGVVTPRELFTQVCKKAARFKGFQQQDSQELLRYLLDGMRAEEIKRVNTAIMEEIKKSGKITDDEQMKKLVKEYERNGFPKNFVDQVFGGEMTSTVMCQQCQTVSVVTEMFLDLSLPVSDEAYRKKNQKKVQKSSESPREDTSSPTLTSGNDDLPGSKYQQKKAKKQAKKQAKQQKRQQKFDSRLTLESLTSPTKTTDQDDSMSGDHPHTEDASLDEDKPAQISVSEQDQENVLDSEEQEEDMDSVAESSSSVGNRFTVLSEEQKPKDDTVDGEQTSDAGQEEDDDEDDQLVDKMERVNLDEAFLQDSGGEEAAAAAEEGEEGQAEDKEYTVVNQDPALAFQTLAGRAAPEKQECSVRSCLFQFTEVETLTQSNSLLCVTCTKRQPSKVKAQGSKNVYTDASKQMLISSPPPVLTLHLKRFQQNGYSLCKVNRHVQFPLLLDLAPYCGVKCKALAEGQTEILYSLYGIVEHSGTMRSGHYTAYVKVRPSGAHTSSNGLAQGDAEAPRGSWFHVSDTSVQPVSESKVQSCQAYLLFYERLV